MNPLVKAAAERIDAATADRPLSGYSMAVAGDVVAVAAAADKEGKDGVIAALLKGASNNSPLAEIWQKTEHLRYMLDKLIGG